MTDPTLRLEQAIARLGADHEPPVGWEARVLAQALAPPPRRRPRWFLPLAMAALVAGLVVLPCGSRPEPLTLALELPDRDARPGALRGGPRGSPVTSPPRVATRGDARDGGEPGGVISVAPGTQVRAVARGGDGDRAIRVYRDGRGLVAACPGHGPGRGPCRRQGDAVSLALALDGFGRYQIIALSAARALPPPTGALEADLGAAREAGATWQRRDVDVP